MTREVITIKRTVKGVWMKRFDDYETKFSRVSEKEAVKDIECARLKGDLFCDDDINSDMPLVFGMYN